MTNLLQIVKYSKLSVLQLSHNFCYSGKKKNVKNHSNNNYCNLHLCHFLSVR